MKQINSTLYTLKLISSPHVSKQAKSFYQNIIGPYLPKDFIYAFRKTNPYRFDRKFAINDLLMVRTSQLFKQKACSVRNEISNQNLPDHQYYQAFVKEKIRESKNAILKIFTNQKNQPTKINTLLATRAFTKKFIKQLIFSQLGFHFKKT